MGGEDAEECVRGDSLGQWKEVFFSGNGEFSDAHFADLRRGSRIRAVFEVNFDGFPEIAQGFQFGGSEA